MVHPTYTASQVAVELAHADIYSFGGCIEWDCMVDSLLDRPTMRCGCASLVQQGLKAVHRSIRSSIRLYVNILALAQTAHVLPFSLIARPPRLRREPPNDVLGVE